MTSKEQGIASQDTWLPIFDYDQKLEKALQNVKRVVSKSKQPPTYVDYVENAQSPQPIRESIRLRMIEIFSQEEAENVSSETGSEEQEQGSESED